MTKSIEVRSFYIALSLLVASASVVAQPRVEPQVQGLVDNVYFVPFITVSGNFHSGQAFPKSARGIGFGGGVEFDLTKDGQKYGSLFDFAWQDMRAFSAKGGCMNVSDTNGFLSGVDAEHYFQYALLEGFLKVQGEKATGYFLIGASMGYAVKSLSVMKSPNGVQDDLYSAWEATEYSNPFRFDLRGGVGLILANIGTRKLIFEGRFGYPITAALNDYNNICNGSNEFGGWRLITIQANLGLRL